MYLTTSKLEMVVYDSHSVRRDNVAVSLVIFPWFVEIESLAGQNRRVSFRGSIWLGSFLRLGFLFGLLFLDLMIT